MKLILAAVPALVLSAGPARAAAGGPAPLLSLCLASQPATGPADLWASWSLAPEVLLPLLLVLGLYGRGLMTLRRRDAEAAPPWQAACFAAGWLALVIALVSPLCRMAAALASAHMVQHVILVAIAPPLLVLAAPMAALVHGLPRRWHAVLAKGAAARPLQVARRSLGAPTSAAVFYGAAIWLWHSPLLYQAALLGAAQHLLMYAVLIAAGLLFWRSLVATAWHESGGHGGAILSALATTIHTGLLGALLTFAPIPWYPLLTPRAAGWGLSALEDQQLAGLIMWVPMGLIYVVSSVCLIAAWLNVIERRHPARPDLELYRRAGSP